MPIALGGASGFRMLGGLKHRFAKHVGQTWDRQKGPKRGKGRAFDPQHRFVGFLKAADY